MAVGPEARLVDRSLVKAHLIAGFTFFFIALLAGFFFSLQFLRHYPFPGVELLSPGRVRMIHTSLVAYGFIANAFLGGLNWAIPRLTGYPVLSGRLGWLLFWVWQLILVLNMGGILGGQAQGIEWGETPIFVDPLVVIGVLLLSINFFAPIIKARARPLYISLWYFTAALVWTALNYIMGNYFPQFFVPGAAGAAIAGLFIHDLVGLFVTPIGWGLMYYFVPTILRKPIWSHSLGLIGFWGLAFFYPLNGIHHFLWSPIPMYVQYGAVTATVAVEVVVTTVIVNFFMTLRGSGDYLRTSLPIRWMYAGMIGYMLTCLQCAVQVLLVTQEVIHFTDWVVGHAHLVMFGVFGFWILGFMTELWPRVTGRPWYSSALNEWHFWLTVLGMYLMFFTLLSAGLLQGYLWKGLNPWEDSLSFSIPFWAFRSLTGLMIIAGQILFAINMWKTAKGPAPRIA